MSNLKHKIRVKKTIVCFLVVWSERWFKKGMTSHLRSARRETVKALSGWQSCSAESLVRST